MYCNLPPHEQSIAMVMAEVWDAKLRDIETNQLAYWFGQAFEVLAYEPERGRKFTAMEVWYAWDAHRRGQRPADGAPTVKFIPRE